ncbi:MAG: hypothetical protein FWC00_00455 [Firmicutes bacterium]|nr:hypothetical protein [Bacillota bacterium]
METRSDWAQILKRLRDASEEVILSVISNLDVTFTHDAINIYVEVKSTYDMLVKNQAVFDSDKVKIHYRPKSKNAHITMEQKLGNLFGDRLFVEV